MWEVKSEIYGISTPFAVWLAFLKVEDNTKSEIFAGVNHFPSTFSDGPYTRVPLEIWGAQDTRPL